MTRGKAHKPNQRARGETRHLDDAFRLEEHELLAAFGATVRERRLVAGLSQAELGAWTFMNDGQVSAIERGARRASLIELLLFAGALDSSVAALTFGLIRPTRRDARATVLEILAECPGNSEKVAEEMGVPWAYARALLRYLACEGRVERSGGDWRVSDTPSSARRS